MANALFHSEHPYYIDVDDELEIGANPEADPQVSIKLDVMKWPCEENKFCHLKEFMEKKGGDAKVAAGLEGFEEMIKKTPEKAKTKENCLVL